MSSPARKRKVSNQQKESIGDIEILIPKSGFKSWMPKLIDLSSRWQWYSELMFHKRLPDRDFPQIYFSPDKSEQGLRMVENCLKPFRDITYNDFLKFLLNRFGYSKHKTLPKVIKKKHRDHWESTFDLKYAINCHHDFLGEYYQQNEMTKNKKKMDACFLTPEILVSAKAEIILQNVTVSDFKTVYDPCCGSGRQLLAGSNRSLYLYGQDVEETCVLMTLVNGFLFAPQIVCPPPEDLKENQANYEKAQEIIRGSYFFDLIHSEKNTENLYRELLQFLKLGSPEKIPFQKNARFYSLLRILGFIHPFDKNQLERLHHSKRTALTKGFENFWKS